MYQSDFEEFAALITDLCISVNRPCNDDLVRVFWEDLRSIPLGAIQSRATTLRINGKKNFNSNDLRPLEDERSSMFGSVNPMEVLTRYVMQRKSLTPAQYRGWKWLGTSAITGVEIPADGDQPGYRVMLDDALGDVP